MTIVGVLVSYSLLVQLYGYSRVFLPIFSEGGLSGSPDGEGPGGGRGGGTAEPTITRITSFSSPATDDEFGDVLRQVAKGGEATVTGVVQTEDGEPVDGMPVVLTLNSTNTQEDTACGTTVSSQGEFEANCVVPSSMTVGQYFLTARSLGTVGYQPSESNPQTVVVFTFTELQLEAPRFAKEGNQASLTGTVVEEFGDPVQQIDIDIVLNESVLTVVQTGQDGEFSLDTPPLEEGDYTAVAQFGGNPFYRSSSATSNLSVGDFELQATTPPRLVRGSETTVEGVVRFDDVPTSDIEVSLSLGGETLASFETDEEGSFSETFLVNSTLSPGNYTIAHRVAGAGTLREETVELIASTVVAVSAPDSVKRGASFDLAVQLRDDMGTPIPFADVAVAEETLRTDDQGRASTSLSVDEEFGGDEFVIQVRYGGDSSHAPAELSRRIAVGTQPIWPYLISGGAVAVAGLLAYTYTRRRTRGEEGEESERLETSLELKLVGLLPSSESAVAVGESLDVSVALWAEDGREISGETVEVSVDGEEEAEVESGTGRVTLEFERVGRRIVEAQFDGSPELQPAATLRSVLVVEFSEEIVEVFDSLLSEARDLGFLAEIHLTAREIGEKLTSLGMERESSMTMTDLFEEARYSRHSLARDEYEAMMELTGQASSVLEEKRSVEVSKSVAT